MLNSVGNEVLAIIVISDFARYLSTSVSLNGNLENIATRLSVETFVVTSLNHELYWFANCLLLKKAWAKAERLEGTSVHEVSEGNECGRKFVSED